MASSQVNFRQSLISLQDIIEAIPDASPAFQNDYFDLKFDLSQTADSSDDLTERVEGLELRMTIVEGQVASLEARMNSVELRLDNVEALSASNATRLNNLEPRVGQNEQDIADNFEYLNGQVEPALYDELASYSLNDVITSGNTELICIEANGPGVFDPLQWEQIGVTQNAALLNDAVRAILNELVYAAYGSIGLNAATPLADIAIGVYQTLPFDVELITSPKDITYNLASNAMSFDREGVYALDVKISLTFDDVNAGRQLFVRFYNITTATAGTVIFVEGVGRNTDAGGVNFPAPVTITDLEVGDEFRLEVSGNAAFTNVTAIGSIWRANHISETKVFP